MEDLSDAANQRLRFMQDHTVGRGKLFMSKPMLHQILPLEVTKVIVLDSDVALLKDLLELWRMFDDFCSHQVVGMQWEQQPVFEYGKHGVMGLNGGVQLLDLERMRSSELYEKTLLAVLDSPVMASELGDQDLYTAMHMAKPEMFFVLPCQWNLQLCDFWFVNRPRQLAQWVNFTAQLPGFPHQHICTEEFALIHGNCRGSKHMLWRVYNKDAPLASYLPEVRYYREAYNRFFNGTMRIARGIVGKVEAES
jgi:hypothetical protein